MSKFWGGDHSDSDSFSDEDTIKVTIKKKDKVSDSESEEEVRVMRTDNEKKIDNIKKACKNIREYIEEKEWLLIKKEFDTIHELYERAETLLRKDNNIPVFYYQTLNFLDKSVTEMINDSGDLDALNIKALNPLRQKLRKLTKSYGEEYNKFLMSPEADGDVFTDYVEEGKNMDDDNEETNWSDEDDYFSSDSEEEEDVEDLLASGKFTRDFWLKKTDEDEAAAEERRKQKEEIKLKKKAEKLKEKELAKSATSTVSAQSEVIELNPKQVKAKLKEVLALRGKRNTDRSALLQELKNLSLFCGKTSATNALLLKIRVCMVSALFDLNLNSSNAMKTENWKAALNELNAILLTLNSNSTLKLTEEEVVDSAPNEFEDDATTETTAAIAEAKAEEAGDDEIFILKDGFEFVTGNLLAFLTRLSDEFVRSLQQIDYQSMDYIYRLKDEGSLEDLISKVAKYYETLQLQKSHTLTSLLALEYFYYKYDPEFDLQAKFQTPEVSESSMFPGAQTSKAINAVLSKHPVHQLATLVLNRGEARARSRAVLCHIYWLSRHTHFYAARDLIMLSHIADNIVSADMSTKILFNRAMTQFGLCAFRVGEIQSSFFALSELYSTSQTKRLLAQGVAKFDDKTSESEKLLEKARQVPFHMHINVDMIDGVHQLLAMLLEVPNMALHPNDHKYHVISKKFRGYLEQHMRQMFVGPPENTRDFVMNATQALMVGDWSKSIKFVMSLKMWSFMQNTEKVKALLVSKLQEVALRSYLLTFASSNSAGRQCYSSLSQDNLASMFELPIKIVYKIVSRMIWADELRASLDSTTNSIILDQASSNYELKVTALRYADKLSILVDQNERLLEFRTGEKKDARRDGDRRGFYDKNGQGQHRKNNARGGDRSRGNYREYQNRRMKKYPASTGVTA